MLLEWRQSATRCANKDAGGQSDWGHNICGGWIGWRKRRADDPCRCRHCSWYFAREKYNVPQRFWHLPLFSGWSRETRFRRRWYGGWCSGGIRRTNWYALLLWSLSFYASGSTTHIYISIPGGVLFALEEAASFWNPNLILRTLIASIISSFTLNVVLSAFHGLKTFSYPGLFNLGQFEPLPYEFYEIPIFVLMGCIGGVLGACWNSANIRLSLFRSKLVLFTISAQLPISIFISYSTQ